MRDTATESAAPGVPCAYCYRQPSASEHFQHCARCMKRALCSRECQRADWKAGHRLWCGKCGEVGHDVAIQPAEGKGLGLFALRDFARDELVMVERPIAMHAGGRATAPRQLQAALQGLSEPELAAFRRLAPDGGTDMQKRNANAFTCPEAGPNTSGIFVTMSRINHDCIGNCMRYYDHKHRVRRLTASRAIALGEEITISYMPIASDGDLQLTRTAAVRCAALRSSYGFDCRCRACSDADVGEKVERVHELLDQVQLRCNEMRVDAAIRAGEQNLKLIDELGLDAALRAFVFSDLFQVAVMQRSKMAAARRYAAQVVTNATAAYGEEDDMVVKYKRYAEKPETFPMYCMADRMAPGQR